MILNRPLTFEEKKSSQHNYKWFNIVNGASYMCLGETILILLAVKMKCSDAVVAALGTMQYVGYMLLPLGKLLTARSGAAASQAHFWVFRNIAVLIVAAAIPVSLWVSHDFAVFMLLGGSFLFYGFRAAGVVMSGPLYGEICDTATRGRFISAMSSVFYMSGLAALIVISLLLKCSSSIWMLFSVVVTGSILGITSSQYIRNVHETGQIKQSAREPIMSRIGTVLKLRIIRSQIIGGMACYTALLLTVPVSMLALKRGYSVSDTDALVFGIIQFAAAAGSGYLQSRLADRFGSRKMLLIAYCCFIAMALLWIMSPGKLQLFYSAIPFILGAYAMTGVSNFLVQYYLETVPKKLQIVSSMVISICTGVFAGLISMGIAGGLLNLAAHWNTSENPLTTYRLYFFFLLFLLPPLGILVYRLKETEK